MRCMDMGKIGYLHCDKLVKDACPRASGVYVNSALCIMCLSPRFLTAALHKSLNIHVVSIFLLRFCLSKAQWPKVNHKASAAKRSLRIFKIALLSYMVLGILVLDL